MSRGGPVTDNVEKKYVDKAQIQGGVKLRAGHPVILIVALKNATHILALTLKAVGGTPFANERVQVIDPETGDPVGEPVTTDENGELRAPVPAKKKYRVRALSDDPLESDDTPRPAVTLDDHLHIAALFLDESEQPLANEPVSVTHGGDKSDGTTDESGWFHLSADAGLFVLEVRKKQFWAFPAPSDAATGGYRFVVSGGA
jgi:hypothetical protein